MAAQPASPAKLFTVERANAALPLVRAICEDLAALSKDVVERRERLAALRGGRKADQRDVYSEELAQAEEELEKDLERLQGFVDELRELGVEPKNPLEGLVDFPCQMEGRIVFLCWKLGEPEVLFWHELEAGFAGRQPLATADAGQLGAGDN